MMDTKVALVSGASRGIGREVAKILAARGVHVIALARNASALDALQKEIVAAGGACTPLAVDLLDEPALARALEGALAPWGRLDMLVGNAGMLGDMAPVHALDGAMWERVFAINVHANLRLIRLCDGALKAAKAARAVFVTSGASQSCKPNWGVYAASKAALDAMVRVYAHESAGSGLKVNLFDPGRVHTDMRAEAYPDEDKSVLASPEKVAQELVAMLDGDIKINGERVRSLF